MRSWPCTMSDRKGAALDERDVAACAPVSLLPPELNAITVPLEVIHA